MGSRRHGLGKHRAAHIAVSPGLEQERTPEVVGVSCHPIALLRHRLSRRPWHALNDEPQRLACDVRINGLQGLTHAPPSGQKGCDALRKGQDPTDADAARPSNSPHYGK
jgi:hypothetical protein